MYTWLVETGRLLVYNKKRLETDQNVDKPKRTTVERVQVWKGSSEIIIKDVPLLTLARPCLGIFREEKSYNLFA